MILNDKPTNTKSKEVTQVQQDQSTIKSEQLPKIISSNLREQIDNLIALYNKQTACKQDIWTDEYKALLFSIYKQSLKLNQNEKSQLFNFISLKTNQPKESLFRRCRRMFHKQSSTSSSPLNLSVTHQPPTSSPSKNQITNQQQQAHVKFIHPTLNVERLNIPINSSTINSPMKSSPSLPSSSPSPQFEAYLEKLNPEIRKKLENLDKLYETFKQKNQVGSFFDIQEVKTAIYMLENSIRLNSKSNPGLKSFCMIYLNRSLKIGNKEAMHKKFDLIVNQIKTANIERNLNTKLEELRKEIDAEMPKNLARYKKAHEEFLQIKSSSSANDLTANGVGQDDLNKKKSLNPPRKRFEWTQKIKELFLNIVNTKLNIYKLQQSALFQQSSASNVANNSEEEQNKKMEYLKQFFQTSLISLWPESWMQMNVLITKYQQSQLQQPQQTTPSSPTTSLKDQSRPTPTTTSTLNTSAMQTPNQNQTPTRPINTMSSQQASSSNSSANKMISTTPTSTKFVQNTNGTTSNGTSTQMSASKSEVIAASSKSGKRIVIEPSNTTPNAKLVQPQATNPFNAVKSLLLNSPSSSSHSNQNSPSTQQNSRLNSANVKPNVNDSVKNQFVDAASSKNWHSPSNLSNNIKSTNPTLITSSHSSTNQQPQTPTSMLSKSSNIPYMYNNNPVLNSDINSQTAMMAMMIKKQQQQQLSNSATSSPINLSYLMSTLASNQSTQNQNANQQK